MVFRTEINLNKSAISINYKNKILLLGSCFSENIGNKLENLHFKATINPFGTIYNAVSIFKVLERAAVKKLISAEELDCGNKLYSHSDFHSSFNSEDTNNTVYRINQTIADMHDQLTKTDITFITLGTSWVYKKIEGSCIVSNCHKRPQHLFEKHLLSINETQEYLNKIVATLQAINPYNKIIFTISPVRHIKDGIVENQVSKAILVQAVYSLCQNKSAHYFPSYEVMMDDLRDYRFYTVDLIHPTDQAISYIWEKFENYYFEEETINLIEKIDKINIFLKHRPMFVDEKYRLHYQKIENEIAEIEQKTGLSINIEKR
jgi:hypothetical protein